MKQTETVELFDLDGTCNDEDMVAVMEGKDVPPEIEIYISAAAIFVNGYLNIGRAEIFDAIKSNIASVFPNRSRYESWGTFPSTEGQKMKICPAVDHYLLVPLAIEGFLKSRLAQEPPGSVLADRIVEFLDLDWRYPLYKSCSEISLPYASIDEDAIGVLESRMRRGALPAIFTNSNPDKAKSMLNRIGIDDRYIVNGGVQRGKIGVVGNARKFEVDGRWRAPSRQEGEHQLDLSAYFGEEGVVVDLRRRHFYQTVANLMEGNRARRVWMASDVPELDLYPLMDWKNFNPRVAMRINSTSSPESIRAVQAIHAVKVGRTLSEISADLE